MNKGKICIPVFAETLNELEALLRRAERQADIVELRFDYLTSPELSSLPRSSKALLLTFRPKNQGGQAPDDINQRVAFWNKIFSLLPAAAEIYLDLEYDLIGKTTAPPSVKIIRSLHNFDEMPANFPDIYKMLAANGDIVKIAYSASDITDTIPIFQLPRDKPFIAIAMGESGKLTRILTPAFGAFLTFASLEIGGETAIGQITARDMNELFRVREIGSTTSVYGVIAGNTSYSISPILHNAAFKADKLDAVYLPLQTVDIAEFIKRMVRLTTRETNINFAGFSVTNPHKQAIIPHLDAVDEIAAKIGAVNTVTVENGKLIGSNTDAYGFIEPLKQAFPDLKGVRVAVFGAGGAARACVYALLQAEAKVTVFARDPTKANKLVNDFGVDVCEFNSRLAGFDIVVNTTPMGTLGPTANQTAATADQLADVKVVYDLVYNPAETLFMREAKAAGVPIIIGGFEMLVAQAARQYFIWMGHSAPIDIMRHAVQKHLNL